MIDKNTNPDFILSKELILAIKNNSPVVALETAVLTHGLPQPQNILLSKALESEVRSEGAIPATIGILDGKLCIGLSETQIEQLGSTSMESHKISTRDIGIAIALNQSGGTTVAASIFSAHLAGIRVFATGGIGGVHRDSIFDISTDLQELARRPVLVVCSGAKAILNLPATLEQLETLGVPVIGFETDEFPAFYSRNSGLPVNVRVNTPAQLASIAIAHWEFMNSALLVVVPPPQEVHISFEEMETIIREANDEGRESGIHGNALTPFLLKRVNELTGGDSLNTNLALLKNNARIAAKISKELQRKKGSIPIKNI